MSKGLLRIASLLTITLVAVLIVRQLHPAAPALAVTGGNPVSVGVRLCSEPILGRIQLRNESNRTIVIDGLQKYCGCLSAGAGKLPLTLQANMIADLEYALAPLEVEGTFEHFIDVQCRGYSSPFRVILKGEVCNPLPPEWILGAFEAPYEHTERLRPVAASRGCELKSAHSVDVLIRPAARHSALTIGIPETAVGARVDSAVDVTYDHCPVSAQRIWVKGHASGGLTAEPETVRLGRLVVDSPPVSREVTIRDQAGRSFEMDSLLASSEDLSVELLESRGSAAILRVTYSPARPRSIDDRILIHTTDSHRGLSIQCVGLVEAPR